MGRGRQMRCVHLRIVRVVGNLDGGFDDDGWLGCSVRGCAKLLRDCLLRGNMRVMVGGVRCNWSRRMSGDR